MNADSRTPDPPATPKRVSLLVLNPLAQAASSEAASRTAAASAAMGKPISCAPRCSACCRQLVAISTVEAVGLADLVAEMPPERQAAVRERFADTLRKLEAAGMLDARTGAAARSFNAPPHLPPDQALRTVGRVYFNLQIGCPFLEDETCSIYPNRPTICREYQVITPAEWCSRAYATDVGGIKPDVMAAHALMATANQLAGLPQVMIPLPLSLEWAERLGPDIRRERFGPELVQAFETALQEDRDARAAKRRPAPRQEEATANIEFGIAGRKIGLEVTVPTVPTTARAVLPLGRALADVASRVAVEDAAKAGTPVSCQKGCGACCRHLVPLSEPEAFEIASAVRVMPEPRRSELLTRFAAARARAEAAGLWPELMTASLLEEDELMALKRAYFELREPCPFLDNESCSIYADRPLVCREYMVNSPAEFCSDPNRGRVTPVSLPVISPFRSFAKAAHESDSPRVGWIPLVAVLEWADERPDPPPTRTGPEWLRAVFAEMTGTAAPDESAAGGEG